MKAMVRKGRPRAVAQTSPMIARPSPEFTLALLVRLVGWFRAPRRRVAPASDAGQPDFVRALAPRPGRSRPGSLPCGNGGERNKREEFPRPCSSREKSLADAGSILTSELRARPARSWAPSQNEE